MTDKTEKGAGKIFPRNLTARAAYQVPGNPMASRLEKGVANSYPGLEMHIRSLDNRFFPGLMFAFVDLRDNPPATQDPQREGAKLLYVDNSDPAIYPPREDDALALALYNDLTMGDGAGAALGEGIWYLETVEQGGKTIHTVEHDGTTPLGGLYVWRLVRSLAPGPVTIHLKRRDAEAKPVKLKGWRRRFTDPVTGVIDLAFKPGELGSSLCSPWTHDFRDCACHYWASNHPDIVHGVSFDDAQRLPDGQAADPVEAHTPLDWLRADRTAAGHASVEDTIEKNRPYQMDHYEINSRWQELNFVLQNYEIGEAYQPITKAAEVKPFKSAKALAKVLEAELAPLEMVLLVQYLYARYSVKRPEECDRGRWPTLAEDVAAIRHILMLVAVGEMTHLRWANQLLWGLYNAGVGLDPADYTPVLTPAKKIPIGKTWMPRGLRRLVPATLDDFIEIERPSGFIEGAYARVVATLKEPQYPRHLYELALRIDSDGVEHFSRFSFIKTRLQAYGGEEGNCAYLRDLEVGSRSDAKKALKLFEDKILPELATTFDRFAEGDFDGAGQEIQVARQAMRDFDDVADKLAAKGVGIPFWHDADD